ncbi:MAG: MFS transporter [Phycisphaerae bacterium]|nr:MFS transporter [Phycisphaerae bacterium]
MPRTSANPRPSLPRSVILLGWVSFFADVSGEMIYPLIPLFVVGVLGASATTLGTIEGAATFMVALVTAWAGWRSDRRRRRVPYVRMGYGLPVIGKALLAVAVAWPMVLAGRLTDRFGKGLRTSPRDALIADAAGPEMRGRAFGFHRALDTAGALVGVLLAAALLWWLTDSPTAGAVPEHPSDHGWAYRLIFGISAALGLLSLALTFFLREPEAAAHTESIAPPTSHTRRRLPATYWRAIAPLLVFSLANSSDAFLLLRARDVGLSPWTVVIVYALFNITYTAFSYPAGIISDRIGRWKIIALGWAIYAAVYIGFAFTGAAGIWPLMAFYGLYMALTEGIGKALVADHAPPAMRGTALGVFSLANGLLTLLASTIAGVLWDRLGPSAAFTAGAALAVIALCLIPVMRPRANSGQPDITRR